MYLNTIFMKYLVTVICCLLSLKPVAQHTSSIWFPSQQVELVSDQDIQKYLFSTFNELQQEGIKLQLNHKLKAQSSLHYEYSVLFNEIQLLNSTIKVNTDLQGLLLSIKNETKHLDKLAYFNPASEVLEWSKQDIPLRCAQYWYPSYSIQNSYLAIHADSSTVSVVLVANSWNKTHDFTLVLNLDGTLLCRYDNSRYANIDTVVNVRVFNPDPLTTLGLNYGGIHIDNNDANDSWIQPAYVDTTVRATYDNSTNTFYLENPYIIIDDIETPSIPPVTSSTPFFIFDRSQTGFEDANACYHITTFHDYISSIGYDTLMDVQLVVDTHAQNGADNSVFHQNGGNPNIMYGQGGVDDAEDADVLVHEYSHGLSWSANHNSMFSFERSGLDEGLADYFATSYSRTINPFNWEKVFSWDGPIWGGRIANSTINYPIASGNYYTVGEIWNSAMSAIWTDLGAIITDKLMLESMHFFTNNTTLPEAAIYILQSDTILFGGIHTSTICSKFQARNILDGNCKPVGLLSQPITSMIQLENTLGFSNRTGDAVLKFPKSINGQYELYNMFGQIVRTSNFKQQVYISISPLSLPSGVYVLKVETSDGELKYKLSVN